MRLTQYIECGRTDKRVRIDTIDFGELYTNAKAIFYDLPIRNKTYNIFAFVAYPNVTMPVNGYPAVLLIHGGYGMAYIEAAKMWADRGYVAIAPDFNSCCGQSLAHRNIHNPFGGPDGYGDNAILTDDPWAFFSVLSAMRAIDVLCGDPRVDGAKICSCGLSWGGFLNLLLTAFDKRIKASSIIYSSAFTDESEWGRDILSSRNDLERRVYSDYIEPSNYLGKITQPTLFTAGADDIAFKMYNRQKTAEQMNAKTYFALRKSFHHGNFIGFEQPETGTFFDCILNGNDVPVPTYNIRKDMLTVKAHAKNSDISVFFTKNDLILTEQQKWENRTPIRNNDYDIDQTDKAFFVEEKTKCGEIWSSELVIL